MYGDRNPVKYRSLTLAWLLVYGLIPERYLSFSNGEKSLLSKTSRNMLGRLREGRIGLIKWETPLNTHYKVTTTVYNPPCYQWPGTAYALLQYVLPLPFLPKKYIYGQILPTHKSDAVRWDFDPDSGKIYEIVSIQLHIKKKERKKKKKKPKHYHNFCLYL